MKRTHSAQESVNYVRKMQQAAPINAAGCICQRSQLHLQIQLAPKEVTTLLLTFMVYLSLQYQQLHPEMPERIKQSVDKEYYTDKLIYAVMDAIGCKFADNDDVAKYSLFAKDKK